jgi:WD40 repeat protein
MGIFLYDRETGNIERIDRGYDGSAVKGESYDPNISADGRWITFWSSANNLMAAGSEVCARETGSLGRCGNLYVYDRDTNEIRQVPIGRSREQQLTGGKPSISSDGGLIAFTIYKDDWIASELGLNNEQEAVIYDAKEGKFSPVNISMAGSIGNAGSYGPSISWDGHLVAFASEASNLVPEDTNGASDVFVRDLETETIERVSVSSDGKQGSNSGSETNSPWGPVVDISREGRFVVFTSGMNDLSNKPSYLCDHSREIVCNSIYIRDRGTGKTERIISPQRDRYYLFPEISEDGRWVTFMEMAADCSPESVQQVCGEVWIYDRQLEWINAVSKGRFQYPEARTFNSQLREIPEESANIAFSPDGETVATTVFDAKDHTGMINLWELEQGAHKSFIPEKRESTITSLAFSPDGQYLAAGTQEGDVKIWRLSNQQLGYDLDGQTGRVIKILFSPDGRRVAVGTQHSVWVWEFRDKTFVRVAASELHGDGLVDLDISPDANWVALAMEDRTVWLQNIKTGKIVLRLENGGKNPLSLTFSPDGKALAVASGDGGLHLWELVEEAGDMLKANYQKNLAHPDGVSKVAFSPNGKYLVSLTLEGFLRIWNYPEGYILNTLPEIRWYRVNSFMNKSSIGSASWVNRYNLFAISPKGELLATISWTGPTRIFQGSSEVDKPRFFIRAKSDEFSIPLAFPPDSALWGWQSSPVTLYQANSLLDFDLQAPTYLPPGLIFKDVHYLQPNDAAWLQYQYYEDPQLNPKATLFITQKPIAPEISDLPVGVSARVESVRVNDVNAEFIQGDWVPEGSRSEENNGFGTVVPMKWDPNAASLQLRFQVGNRMISILYRQDEVKSGEFPYINKADLVAIAQSLININRPFQTAPITISYTVQEGDTCTSIASRFGTTIGEIVHLNGLPGNCDIIYEGQTLTVSLTEKRETLTETDLDCDGTPERVLLIPNPIPTGTPTYLGVIVERLSRIGFYQEAWQYTIGETDLRLFTQPQIFSVNDCTQDLAINLLPRNAGFTQFEIYHWDGEIMRNAVQPDLIETRPP